MLCVLGTPKTALMLPTRKFIDVLYWFKLLNIAVSLIVIPFLLILDMHGKCDELICAEGNMIMMLVSYYYQCKMTLMNTCLCWMS